MPAPAAPHDPYASDVIYETTSTGRTRRLLNVEARRARIMTFQSEKQGQARLDQNGFPLEQQKPSLYDFFDRVVVVNLDRRPDRMDRLHRHLAEVGWPFRYPERFSAIDGSFVKPPKWWGAGAPAWGCLQSHLHIIERALMEQISRLLILEDDVFFEQGFMENVARFIDALPKNWQQIYLGGQHLCQREHPPVQINEEVIKPYNVNRTHAFALHRRGMLPVYRWLTDYVKHSEHPGHHVDHRLGQLHSTEDFHVYAPTRWIAGQFQSLSNITGRVTGTRIWNGHPIKRKTEPLVAVLGVHRSGSSCLAGVLHKLGVFMGNQLGDKESTGNYEAQELSELCEAAYPFPSFELQIESDQLESKFSSYIQRLQRDARSHNQLAGGESPHFCLMGDLLKKVAGEHLKVIHINRPLEESIESLKTHSHNESGILAASDEACERLQRELWKHKNKFLQTQDHLTVDFHSLLADPESVVSEIIEYLKILPTQKQRAAAVAHVRPELRKHFGQP